MLQQTRVSAVIPYWERWMRALPTVRALAEAREDRVLKLWEGLGYYSRARNLQKAARMIVNEHSGAIPTTLDEVEALPGIGRYTAGAICSIAFGKATPILDGNVIRVLTRVFGLRGNPKAQPLNGRLWGLAGELVEAAKAFDACSALNQGLMELGALVCLPREPQCLVCPLQRLCRARAANLVESLPELPERAKATARIFRAALAVREDSILLVKRVGSVVNSGFWELPNAEVTGRESAAKTLARLGFKLSRRQPLAEVRHSITRYRMRLEVFAAEAALESAAWISISRLKTLPVVNAHRRALEEIGILRARTGRKVKVPMEKTRGRASL